LYLAELLRGQWRFVAQLPPIADVLDYPMTQNSNDFSWSSVFKKTGHQKCWLTSAVSSEQSGASEVDPLIVVTYHILVQARNWV